MENELYVVALIQSSERAREAVGEVLGNLATRDLLAELTRPGKAGAEDRLAELAMRIQAKFAPPALPSAFTESQLRQLAHPRTLPVLAAVLGCAETDVLATLLDSHQLGRTLDTAGNTKASIDDSELLLLTLLDWLPRLRARFGLETADWDWFIEDQGWLTPIATDSLAAVARQRRWPDDMSPTRILASVLTTGISREQAPGSSVQFDALALSEVRRRVSVIAEQLRAAAVEYANDAAHLAPDLTSVAQLPGWIELYELNSVARGLERLLVHGSDQSSQDETAGDASLPLSPGLPDRLRAALRSHAPETIQCIVLTGQRQPVAVPPPWHEYLAAMLPFESLSNGDTLLPDMPEVVQALRNSVPPGRLVEEAPAVGDVVPEHSASRGSVPAPTQDASHDHVQGSAMPDTVPAAADDQEICSPSAGSAMPDRDTALNALSDLMVAWEDNRELLCTDAALRAANQLAATTDTATDLPVAQVLGRFHWNRFLSLPEGDDYSDWEAAIRYFAPICQASPDAIPWPVQQAIRDREQARASSAVETARQAFRLVGVYEDSWELGTLTDAIELFRVAAAEVPAGYPDRASHLSNLGNALQMLAERTGDTGALTEALSVKREAIAAAPADNPDRAKFLSSLGAALQMLAEWTGDTSALIEAVQAGRDAEAIVSDDDPTRVGVLINLGIALHALAKRTSDTGALTEAVTVKREAVAAAPADNPDRPRHLSSLGISLQMLAEWTGDTGGLIEAVQAGRDAVAAVSGGHPDRAMLLGSLGKALWALAERTGDTDAAAEAVTVMRDAVAATPAVHPDRAGRLGSLGTALWALAERTGDTDAAAEAVTVMRDAVAAAPDGHPDRAMLLGNLGTALEILAERTGDTGALGEAVQCGRDAVAATPADHPDRAGFLGNLGGALQALAERTDDADVLTEAINMGRAAVAAAPHGHPNRSVFLGNLGRALKILAERTGDTGALAEATSCFRGAGSNTEAAVHVRIRGWQAAAAISADGGGGPQDALAAAEAAVELLPQLTPRWLSRVDREHRLGETSSLAEVSAAAAVAAGRPERAAELLEQTRGVLTADTVNARSSDLTRLWEIAPRLASEFEELRTRLDALDQPGIVPSGGSASSGIDQDPEQAQRQGRALMDARRSAQTAWSRLIARIRAVDGFAGFLAVPAISELAAQAHDGPIVFVYTSPSRCDALILTRDPRTPIQLVPLTALSGAAVVEQVNRLLRGSRDAADPSNTPRARVAAQNEILEILAWTWDTITEPVLTALGHTAVPGGEEPWSRVWWSPVGVLAYLPLHAAGHHSDLTAGDTAVATNPRTVLDRVISSYAPTVRSLAYARAHHATATDDTEAVIVSAPEAPGAPPLPGVIAETATLSTLLPGAVVLNSPTHDTVLSALSDHPVAHFSCHGQADLGDPANSSLILPDHRTAPLTVADISALRLTADLAYLSACNTAITSQDLVDEAVHITGAFHLAGYQHVIGTLWPINDALASDITGDFYNDLTEGGTVPPQVSRSAHALHRAIRRARARYPQAPTLWAAHTHTGP